MSVPSRIAVVVAERDGDWSPWIESLGDEVDDVTVVLQRQGESPSALATRVRQRVSELEGDLVAAALVGGSSWDSETLSARSLMIRAVVSQMVASGRGQLFLDAGAHVGRSRHAMQALASVVEDQIVDTGVDVLTTRPERRAASERPAAQRRAA